VTNMPLYAGMNTDQQWNQACQDEDRETWTSITGGEVQDITCDNHVARSGDSDSGSDINSEDDDDVMKKARGLKFSTCLQPSEPQYSATDLCVALAEGQTPLDLMLDTTAEVFAFCGKFPLGIGGLTDGMRGHCDAKEIHHPATTEPRPRQVLCQPWLHLLCTVCHEDEADS